LTRGHPPYYFHAELGEPRQGAERPTALEDSARGDPPNLIQLMLA
jgi:hypothetical protein